MPVSFILKSKSIYVTSDNNVCFASAALFLCDYDLFVYAILQISNVRNDTDKAISVCQTQERFHSLIQRLLIKRAKALIYEHGIKLNATGRCLNLIRKAQRKRERCFERLAAGKRFDTSLGAVVMVNNVKIESALAAVILCFFATFQLILSTGHYHKASIGSRYDTVKIRHLDIGFQHYFFFSGDISVCRIGQGFQPCIAFFKRVKISDLCSNIGQYLCIGLYARMKHFGNSVIRGFLFCYFSFLLCFLFLISSFM